LFGGKPPNKNHFSQLQLQCNLKKNTLIENMNESKKEFNTSTVDASVKNTKQLAEKLAAPAPTDESSLTAPEDRDPDKRWRPSSEEPLTTSQTKEAHKDLHDSSFVRKYPEVERSYADPVMRDQMFGLVSFVPAKGATANKSGVFGFAKLRGNYSTMVGADERSKSLIRYHDSYNQISTCYVGRPFPLTVNKKFSEEVIEIDVRRETAESMSEAIKRQRKKDQREVDEIKDREKLLREDVENDADPYDVYITSKVKKAQLVWTYKEHMNKMEECKGLIIKTRAVLKDLDEKHPDFQDSYFEKYKKARVDAGLKETTEESQNNFMKYLVEDIEVELDF
jgi:hypothetical protein